MENTIDLFEQYETLPQQVINILEAFDEDGDAYQECKKMEHRLLPLGYTFDWGLDGEPFNLRRINER